MLIIMKLGRLIMLLFGMFSFTFLIIHFGFERSHAQDSHFMEEYFGFLSQIVHGDFGVSAVTQQPIVTELIARWPATIELGIVALFFSMFVGVPLGIIAAIHQGKWIDKLLISSSLIGYSMPAFWLALILILFFSVGLDLTPVSGRLDTMYDLKPVTGFMLFDTLLQPVTESWRLDAFWSAVSHLILPAIVLGSVPAAIFARMTRASMLDILSKDYILHARARGLSEFRVICIHAFRNALPPLISVAGLQFVTTVVTGSIVVEVIFGWPGMGSYIIQSTYARDLALIKVFLLSMGMMVLLCNTCIDLIQHLIHVRKDIS